MKKAMLQANEFHTNKVSLTFFIYLLHFIAGRKKFHSQCTQFAAKFIYLFITAAAAFRFCEPAQIILVNEK